MTDIESLKHTLDADIEDIDFSNAIVCSKNLSNLIIDEVIQQIDGAANKTELSFKIVNQLTKLGKYEKMVLLEYDDTNKLFIVYNANVTGAMTKGDFHKSVRYMVIRVTHYDDGIIQVEVVSNIPKNELL